MNKRTVVITGGTGLVGAALAKLLLASNYNVTILSRNAAKAAQNNKTNGVSFVNWDVSKQQIDETAIKQAYAIINLAGAGVVDKPWTEAYKHEILASRVNSSKTIIHALETIENKVKVVINASAIGWYGADKKRGVSFVETDDASNDFLGITCKQWEESIEAVSSLQKRLAIFRFGIVLSKEGGALKEFIKPLKLRVASIIGTGKQIVSWIHIHDLCRMLLFTLENERISGVYNAVAPTPVSSEALTVSLAKAMHGNAYIKAPVPAFVLKLMMGERSIEVLKSTTVSSSKIEKTGFSFQFPGIDNAVRNLVK